MTRPNEFQQLDEDLAAGRLSSEDHRQRRDAPAPDAAGATGNAPQVASPFPPAFRWETSSPEAVTQVMPAIGQDATGEVQDSQRTQVGAPQSSYPTSPLYQGSPSYQQEQGQVRGLFEPVGGRAAPDLGNSAPPWTNSDLPPIAEQPIAEQQSAWMRQGPEVFMTSALQPRSKQIIGIAVLAILMAGLAGAGVAYFVSGGSEQNQASSEESALPEQPTAARQLPAPPAPSPAPVDTPQALIEPPGEPRGGGGLLDLPRLESTDLLPQSILNALRAGAMTDGVLKTTTDGGNTIGMFAFALADEQAATDVVNTIATVQRDGGLKVDDSRAQQGLAVLGSAPGSRTIVYRGVYVLYNRAIFFEVFGSDYDAVLATFDSVLSQQLSHAPPTVRGR
ncbi:MAG: hypothetical protein M3143_08145 [Actinomycetota bacterium]|nr:hypothetical protein [Actinomycetota bacterium]